MIFTPYPGTAFADRIYGAREIRGSSAQKHLNEWRPIYSLLDRAGVRPGLSQNSVGGIGIGQRDGIVDRILLVEDDDFLRTMLRRLLVDLGYAVQEAGNGEEATLICVRKQPDLVITDILMPESEGLEFIKALRRMSSDVKIIAITGGGLGNAANYLFVARSLGADYTFEKPFETEELLSVVRRLLESNHIPPREPSNQSRST
jgi:CheY-like chemotaxis protein